MSNVNKIKELLEGSNNGIITSAQVNDSGICRDYLKPLVDSGDIYRYSRGIYIKSDAWEDDLYLLQQKYKKGIYSHDTALYLLGYSDRTPIKYTMTFPQGYNCKSLKDEYLIVKHTIDKNYELGIIEIDSPSGNPILIYDLERTLCDILKGSGSDIQIINKAMKQYASSKDKNIFKLMKYADQLRVKKKVMHYMEVLLWLLKTLCN